MACNVLSSGGVVRLSISPSQGGDPGFNRIAVTAATEQIPAGALNMNVISGFGSPVILFIFSGRLARIIGGLSYSSSSGTISRIKTYNQSLINIVHLGR